MTAAAVACAIGVACTGPASAASAGAPRSRDASVSDVDGAKIVAEQYLDRRVVELTISTPAFAEETHVDVDLPVGYQTDTSRRWPVTYWTGGTSDRYYTFNQSFDGEQLSANFPSIVVSPDGRSGYWSDWYNAGTFGPPEYETFVIDQLIPLIDAHFRTIPNRAHRAIAGESMGGYGAMMLAARHPDLFAAAASLSGAVDSNQPLIAAAITGSSSLDGGLPDAIYGPQQTEEVRWHGHNPTDLAANLRGLNLQVRTADGELDPAIGENATELPFCAVEVGVHMASVAFDQALTGLGIAHLWKDYGAGCHTPENFKRQIADTFPVFAQVFAHPRPAPTSFDYRSIEPHFDIWGWHIDADPARALEFLTLTNVSRAGLTLAGSGAIAVTTPALFRGLRRVDVGGATSTIAVPDALGRIHFSVDLGTADTTQEYLPGATTTLTTRSVTFAPHAVVEIRHVRATTRTVAVCSRAIGGIVRARMWVQGTRGQRVTRVASITLSSAARCVHLPRTGSGSSLRGALHVVGKDGYGHEVKLTEPVARGASGQSRTQSPGRSA